MKKIILNSLIATLMLLFSYSLYSIDLSKFKYPREEIKMKYYYNIRSETDRMMRKNMFIRDEVARLKKMKLSIEDLFEIMTSDSLYPATRIAALRLIVSRAGKEVIPRLIDLKKYYDEERYKGKGWSLPPSPYDDLSDHLGRAIVEIKIKDMNCFEKIRYMLDCCEGKNLEDCSLEILVGNLSICSKENGFEEFIQNEYTNGSSKRKDIILNNLAIAKVDIAKKYIDIGLKDSDIVVLEGAMYACWRIYGKGCIPRIEKISNDISVDQKIRDTANRYIKFINEGEPNLRDFLERYPLNYGE